MWRFCTVCVQAIAPCRRSKVVIEESKHRERHRLPPEAVESAPSTNADRRLAMMTRFSVPASLAAALLLAASVASMTASAQQQPQNTRVQTPTTGKAPLPAAKEGVAPG